MTLVVLASRDDQEVGALVAHWVTAAQRGTRGGRPGHSAAAVTGNVYIDPD